MNQPRFRPVRFGAGYEPQEVDEFVDRIQRALRTGDGSVTAKGVLQKRFTNTRFSEGYAIHDVDDYLDNVAVPQLRARSEQPSSSEPGSIPGGSSGADLAWGPARPSPERDTPADHGVLHPPRRPGLLSRLFGVGR